MFRRTGENLCCSGRRFCSENSFEKVTIGFLRRDNIRSTYDVHE